MRDAFNTPLRIEVQREAIRLRTLFRTRVVPRGDIRNATLTYGPNEHPRLRVHVLLRGGKSLPLTSKGVSSPDLYLALRDAFDLEPESHR